MKYRKKVDWNAIEKGKRVEWDGVGGEDGGCWGGGFGG